MEELPKDALKAVFDKVNSEDTFSQRMGAKLIELLPVLPVPPFPLLTQP